jgi:hypothetical protein
VALFRGQGNDERATSTDFIPRRVPLEIGDHNVKQAFALVNLLAQTIHPFCCLAHDLWVAYIAHRYLMSALDLLPKVLRDVFGVRIL